MIDEESSFPSRLGNGRRMRVQSGHPTTSESRNGIDNSTKEELPESAPQPKPRGRRLRPPSEIEETQVAEVPADPVEPTFSGYTPSRGPRTSAPLDARIALGPIKETPSDDGRPQEEEAKSAFPFDFQPLEKGRTSERRASGPLFADSIPPIRSPQNTAWDIPTSSRSSGPLSPLSPISSSEGQKPKRRLSQWLAEDLDVKKVAEKEEKKSQLRRQSSKVEIEPEPGSSQSRRASIVDEPPSDLAKGAQKESQQPRSGKRRESIKIHLQRFKQKANKVLEEVHDRFSDDHSSSVAPTNEESKSPVVQSPEVTEISPEDERVTSPTPSVLSKKTTNSAEMKDKMRSKIRKQAEKVVERTRGSVQLAHRLQRKQTIHTPDGPTVEEIGNVDDQIEKGLRLGARFAKEDSSASVFPDHIAEAFMTQSYEEERPIETKDFPDMEYVPAWPSKDAPAEMFVVYETKPEADLETGIGLVQRSCLDFSKMEQRVGRDLLTEDGKLKRIDNFISKIPLKYQPSEFDPPVFYCPAIPWKRAVQEGGGTNFVQLDIQLGKLQFEHHWLAGEEDISALRLHNLHEEQLEIAQNITELLQEVAAKQREFDFSEQSADIESLLNRVSVSHRHFNKLAEMMDTEYGKLRQIRERNGFSVTGVRLRRADGGRDGSNFSLQSLYLLTDDHIPTERERLPNEEIERMNALQRCHLSISIHFNDILVYKTKWRTLDGKFSINFSQIYNLEIYSVPETITATISEKFGRETRDVCTVGIPLPDDNSFTEMNDKGYRLQFASQLQFPRFKTSVGAGMENSPFLKGSMTCNATWSKRGEMKLRFDERRRQQTKLSESEQPFHLIPPDCRLVSDEEFHSDLRWEVLEFRHNRRLSHLPAYKRIGLDSSEVDSSLLFSEDRRLGLDRNYRLGIDGQRAAGARYAVLMRSQLLERFTQTERVKSYEDMVKEEPFPTIFAAFGSLFGPADVSRKLKPMRRPATRQQNVIGKCNLVVNIQSAVNIPLRKDETVQPYVEISFQGKSCRTTVVAGRNANWQQTITLPITCTNEQNGLRTVTDLIEIHLYDQIVEQLERDDREENTVHEQLLKRYLGRVEIPFSTIYCRGKVDGFLRIELPIFFTDYKLSDKPCFLKVLIAIDPAIAPTKLIPPVLNGSVESEKVVSECREWNEFCTTQFEDRRFVALVSDSNGKKVLANRYLRPICPPHVIGQIMGNPLAAAALACRLVSYIPFIKDPVVFPGVSDIWTTVDQFVSIGCGDEEEHAVLLACWMLHVNELKSVYLVLGTALPEGEKAAFVMMDLPNGTTILMNPSDGNVYALDDPLCPLLNVGTVISQSNVYGNIQSFSHPSHLNWDLKKHLLWRPLFLIEERNPPSSVQPISIDYVEINEDTVVELRSSIEREVKMKFDEARSYGIPQWNLMASRTLREILQEFNSGSDADIEERLKSLREAYNVTSTAIQIPYDSLSVCVTAVLRTLLHVNADPNVQFALAVHVEPFFNQIVSCGIAIAAVSSKK